jgi:hypothetical protein
MAAADALTFELSLTASHLEFFLHPCVTLILELVLLLAKVTLDNVLDTFR